MEWEDEPDAQDEHRVRSLFVAPPFWRLGLGSKLLKWAEEQTVVLGGQHILARVPRDAAWVRKFYERAGYTDIGGSGGRLAGHSAVFATYEKLLEPAGSNASNVSNP